MSNPLSGYSINTQNIATLFFIFLWKCTALADSSVPVKNIQHKFSVASRNVSICAFLFSVLAPFSVVVVETKLLFFNRDDFFFFFLFFSKNRLEFRNEMQNCSITIRNYAPYDRTEKKRPRLNRTSFVHSFHVNHSFACSVVCLPRHGCVLIIQSTAQRCSFITNFKFRDWFISLDAFFSLCFVALFVSGLIVYCIFSSFFFLKFSNTKRDKKVIQKRHSNRFFFPSINWNHLTMKLKSIFFHSLAEMIMICFFLFVFASSFVRSTDCSINKTSVNPTKLWSSPSQQKKFTCKRISLIILVEFSLVTMTKNSGRKCSLNWNPIQCGGKKNGIANEFLLHSFKYKSKNLFTQNNCRELLTRE